MNYAIFLDFDDTLFPSSGETQISDRTLKALTDAQNKGHKIFLNTSRPPSLLNVDACRGFKFDGYLCGYSYANVGGKVILSDRLTADETQPIVAHFYGRNIPVLLEGEQASWVAYPPKKGFSSRYLPVDDIGEMFRICELEPIMKISILSLLEGNDLEFVRQFGDAILLPQWDYTEIVPFGHSKATVMQAVLQFLDWDPKHVIAIGDSDNDIPMLEAAEISVAMGNASDEAKAHADHITETVKNDGVARILEEILK